MPVDRLYVTQTAHAIANVRMSGRTIGDLPELLTALKVNIHAPRVNYRAGRLEADIANAIAAVAEELVSGWHHADLPSTCFRAPPAPRPA